MTNMRINMITNKACMFLLVMLLLAGLTGCQNKAADTRSIPQIEVAIIEEDNLNVESETPKQDINKIKETLGISAEDLKDSYWRAVYYETFSFGDMEEYITEYDDDYYRFMDVTFSGDKTAEFRSIVGDNYESASGIAEWKITENGDVVLDNVTPFEGMRYGYGFVPRFSLVSPEYAPNNEEGLISIEYMEGCVYFRKMPKSDPFEGVDLTNADRLKQAIEQSKFDGNDITGEWVLLSSETDGDKWYALESGVECILYVGDTYVNYQYTDSTGYREDYYGMNMTYDDMALYTDLPYGYTIYFHPDPMDYEGRYEYMSFGMAPDGEYLIVQMRVDEIGQEYPTVSYLTFQRGFG